MKSISLLTLLALLISSAGCSLAKPISATSQSIGSRTGTACNETIFGLIPLQKTSQPIYDAAKAGGIKKITTVDYNAFFFGPYIKECTVVHGHK